MARSSKKSFSIRNWAPDDQPRFKLLHKGVESLSDSELLAILIGTGSGELSAVDLCKQILAFVKGDLNVLARLQLADLMKFKGIGEAKAIGIAAALELGRRRNLSNPGQKIAVGDSRSAYQAIAPLLQDKNHEEFWVLFLNRSNVLLDRICISSGGVTGTVADPRLIFKQALQQLASVIILCHNHPSGQLRPSQEDIRLTQKLVEAGRFLDILVADHLIIGNQSYFSFADEGLL